MADGGSEDVLFASFLHGTRWFPETSCEPGSQLVKSCLNLRQIARTPELPEGSIRINPITSLERCIALLIFDTSLTRIASAYKHPSSRL